jgi:uncharacterized protein (DUF2267 family)
MSVTGLPVFDTTVQETNLWLKGVEAELVSLNRQRSYEATRAVLHALRDRVEPDQAMNFAAQLPMLMRGFMTEGWNVAASPTRERTLAAFLAHVEAKLPASFPEDVEETTRGVLAALFIQMGHEPIQKLMSQLPRELHQLFPPAARLH